MEVFEHNTQSFVLRAWIEEQKEGEVLWRGHIKCVGDGREKYVDDMIEITQFVASYLAVWGVRPGYSTRILLWLMGLEKRLKRNRSKKIRAT